jgi:hypothetical protein
MKITVPDEHALVLLAISHAIDEARRKHPQRYVDAHHAMGVMLEEWDEFKGEVERKKLNKRRLETEALDIAAVAARTVMEVCVDPRFSKARVKLAARRQKRGAR